MEPTFGELLAATSPRRQMEVTQAYHSALRNAWNERSLPNRFSVYAAEKFFPEIAAQYRPHLEWFSSPAPITLLREAAGNELPKYIPGARKELVRIPIHRTASIQHARAHANIIKNFAMRYAIPAIVISEGADTETNHCYVVLVDTDDLGCAILRHKPGMFWFELDDECLNNGSDPRIIFWWVPSDVRNRYAATRVNPCLWPVNTPNIDEIVRNYILFHD